MSTGTRWCRFTPCVWCIPTATSPCGVGTWRRHNWYRLGGVGFHQGRERTGMVEGQMVQRKSYFNWKEYVNHSVSGRTSWTQQRTDLCSQTQSPPVLAQQNSQNCSFVKIIVNYMSFTDPHPIYRLSVFSAKPPDNVPHWGFIGKTPVWDRWDGNLPVFGNKSSEMQGKKMIIREDRDDR